MRRRKKIDTNPEREAVMEHINDGSYVEVIKTGRVGEVISRKSTGSVRRTYMPELSIIPERLWRRSSAGSIPSCCWWRICTSLKIYGDGLLMR
jgi:hypothetical protein